MKGSIFKNSFCDDNVCKELFFEGNDDDDFLDCSLQNDSEEESKQSLDFNDDSGYSTDNQGRFEETQNSLPIYSTPLSKRIDRENTKNNSKRKRSTSSCLQRATEQRKSGFKRHHSDSVLVIKRALQNDEDQSDLIADFSRHCSLPTVQGKHRDLTSISSETITHLLNSGRGLTVIDCRYPYEYDGGHINGAINLYTQDLIYNYFVKDRKQLQGITQQRDIIIFHCEFSSERGPKLLRYLREQDRQLNKDAYPALYYPEIYLLDGGYKAFYEYCKNMDQLKLCQPQNYRLMMDEDFQDQLLYYRNKTKQSRKEKRTSFRKSRIGSPLKLNLF